MVADLSPTSRALLALDVLQSRPGIGAERLAEHLGVSTRAVRRYIQILREADIPVESERGPDGGYRLGRGMRLPPLRFDAAEGLSLVMAVLDGHHAAADPHDVVGRALGKILRGLPRGVAAQAESVRRTASAAPDRGAVRPDPQITVTLVEGCADARRLRLTYRSEIGRQREVEVEPWAVVVRYGRWYLLCRSLRSGEARAYRVDRILRAEPTSDVFRPPADLDPVAALEEHLASGWEFTVEVLIHAPFDEATRWTPRNLGRLEPVDADTTRLLGSTSNPRSYVEQLVRIPAGFRVCHGDEVRQAVDAIATRLTAALG